MTGPLPDHPGIDPELKAKLEIIGSPITFMEHTSRGQHIRAAHLVFLADRIMEKFRLGHPMQMPGGDWQFLAAFIPVRHGKSFFLARYLAPWLMGVFPGIKILFVTYSDDRARRWGKAAMDLAREWAPSLFGCTVEKDKEAGSFWGLTNGSEMRCVGIGGQITGEGAHVIIIDDTIKDPKDADSPTIMNDQEVWYYETLRNRLEPGGLMILAQARWREDDLAGRICHPADDDELGATDEVDDWEIIRFPALAEPPPPPDDLDFGDTPMPPESWADSIDEWVVKWRGEMLDEWYENFRRDWRDELGRREGDALWPMRYDRRRLNQVKALGEKRGQQQSWEALWQQNPTPKEGGSFKVDAWRYVGMVRPEQIKVRVRAWDLSASLRKGDYTVGVLMGLGYNGEIYVLNVVRDRLDPAGVQNLVVLTADQDQYDTIIAMEEEKGASGKSNSAVYAQKLVGYRYIPEPVSGSKDVRAAGYAAHQGNGLVYLLNDGSWDVAKFVEEHRIFGAGRHDDQVDAAALGFRTLALGGFEPAVSEIVMPTDDMTPVEKRARFGRNPTPADPYDMIEEWFAGREGLPEEDFESVAF